MSTLPFHEQRRVSLWGVRNATGNHDVSASLADDSLALPRALHEVDAAFMTQVLRRSGAIAATNRVVSQTEQGVGMTAGYFSSIKKVRCTYSEATDAPTDFVVKAWPSLEIAPRDSIAAMFLKDIHGYKIPAEQFYPRPKVHLAAFDPSQDAYVLVMEDAGVFASQKVHEHELTFEEVMRMIPALVDVAVTWEGADEGERAAELAAMGIPHWTSPENLDGFKAGMPGGARLFDLVCCMRGTPINDGRPWDTRLGVPDFASRLTTRLDAFFAPVRPENGATCTIAHGDMRGDNIFFCEARSDHPHGWLCIDFQQMVRGPVSSDLAYLMNSGSVLPEVYAAENQHRVLRAFYDQFMGKTRRYPEYSYHRFVDEYRRMATLQYIYYVAFGAAIFRAGAFENDLGMRVELGGRGAAEADLPPEQVRQRMWWSKAVPNFAETFKAFDLVELLATLPENHDGLGPWGELPEHLQQASAGFNPSDPGTRP